MADTDNTDPQGCSASSHRAYPARRGWCVFMGIETNAVSATMAGFGLESNLPGAVRRSLALGLETFYVCGRI